MITIQLFDSITRKLLLLNNFNIYELVYAQRGLYNISYSVQHLQMFVTMSGFYYHR